MFTDVAAGYLIGDALKAERVQQPIKDLGGVALGNGIKDTGLLNVSADIIKKCQRSGQTTDGSNQLRRTAVLFGDLIGGSTGITSLGRSNRFLGRGWI